MKNIPNIKAKKSKRIERTDVDSAAGVHTYRSKLKPGNERTRAFIVLPGCRQMFEIDLAGMSNELATMFSIDSYKCMTAHLTVRKARARLRQIARGEE